VRVYEVLGYYHDAFVRTNDGWAIQNRRVDVNLRLVTRLYCRPDVLTGVSAHAPTTIRQCQVERCRGQQSDVFSRNNGGGSTDRQVRHLSPRVFTTL
jgi:hypothetical protein